MPETRVGRRSKYEELGGDDVVPRLAYQYALEGLKDKDIAAKLGIGVSTFYEWQNRYPEFREALKEGKKPVDVEVEKALLRRALGYEYEETKRIVYQTPDGEKAARIENVTKSVPPDVTAIIFWLTNRRRDRWRRNATPDGSGRRGLIAELMEKLREAEDSEAVTANGKAEEVDTGGDRED